MIEPNFWDDWLSILEPWQTYFAQGSSLQDFLLKAVGLSRSRPLVFADFYQKLRSKSQVQLPSHPLKRIKELGQPIAQSSLIFAAPVETGILHCCDPYHKETTHRLTAPFLRIIEIKKREFNQDSQTGRVTIVVERGISGILLPGMPTLKLSSYQEEVLWQILGPFSFELTLGKMTILFHLVPLAEESFILEVSLYYQDFLPENLSSLTQKFWQLLCDFTLAEDLVYMEQFREQSRNYFFSPDPPFHPSREVIFLYRELYGPVLSNLLKEAIALN